VNQNLLLFTERLFQKTLAKIAFGPSIFILAELQREKANK
jgi:hypothetical protein